MPARETPREIAREVIRIEAEALGAMTAALSEDFDAVISRLLQVTGRVIVSGMGKSGHIAAKIAATMASTGTPAQYVHPGEASHGDLGMITKADAVILISNSGETRELADIIAHSRRFAIPLVAITKRASSTLGQQADFLLQLPDAPEACAIGMAPTTIFRRILLPQVWRFALPGLGNVFLVIIKETALVSVIGLDELMRKTDIAVGYTKKPFTFYLFAACIYMVITAITMQMQRQLERRANRGVAGRAGA